MAVVAISVVAMEQALAVAMAFPLLALVAHMVVAKIIIPVNTTPVSKNNALN